MRDRLPIMPCSEQGEDHLQDRGQDASADDGQGYGWPLKITRACICSSTCVYIQNYIHTYIHTYVRTYVHTYTYTYTYIYICTY